METESTLKNAGHATGSGDRQEWRPPHMHIEVGAPSRLYVESEIADIQKNVAWFAERPERWRQLAKYVNKEPKAMSLRTIEWFVVNYCKDRYLFATGPDGTRTLINNSYAEQLFTHGKTRCDPFARTGNKNCQSSYVEFDMTDPDTGETVHIRTNRRQLNFFRWMIEYRVLDVAIEHRDRVEAEMQASLDRKRARTTGKRSQHKRLRTRSFYIPPTA